MLFRRLSPKAVADVLGQIVRAFPDAPVRRKDGTTGTAAEMDVHATAEEMCAAIHAAPERNTPELIEAARAAQQRE